MRFNTWLQRAAALILLAVAWPLAGCGPESPARPSSGAVVTQADPVVELHQLPDRVTEVTYEIDGRRQTQRFERSGLQLAAAGRGSADALLVLNGDDNIVRREGAGAANFDPHNGRLPEGQLTDEDQNWETRYVVTGAGASDGIYHKSCSSTRGDHGRWRVRCATSRVGASGAPSHDDLEVAVTRSGQRVIVGGSFGGRTVRLVAVR